MKREWEAAVHRGSIDELQRLLNNGCDIDTRDRHGQTALMLAATNGSGPLVEWLVERGAALDHTAKYGLSALMLAVVRGHVDVVRRLTKARLQSIRIHVRDHKLRELSVGDRTLEALTAPSC